MPAEIVRLAISSLRMSSIALTSMSASKAHAPSIPIAQILSGALSAPSATPGIGKITLFALVSRLVIILFLFDLKS